MPSCTPAVNRIFFSMEKLSEYHGSIPPKQTIKRKIKGGIGISEAKCPLHFRQLFDVVGEHLGLKFEIERDLSGDSGKFLYDIIMKEGRGTPKQTICIDTKNTSFIRRSCDPNSEIAQLQIQPSSNFYFFIRATRSIRQNEEITVAFDNDWNKSKAPLKCASHHHNISECPMEQQRLSGRRNATQTTFENARFAENLNIVHRVHQETHFQNVSVINETTFYNNASGDIQQSRNPAIGRDRPIKRELQQDSNERESQIDVTSNIRQVIVSQTSEEPVRKRALVVKEEPGNPEVVPQDSNHDVGQEEPETSSVKNSNDQTSNVTETSINLSQTIENVSDEDNGFTQEDEKLLEFLLIKSKSTEVPLVLAPIMREFIEENQLESSVDGLRHRFRKRVAPVIHKYKKFDLNAKVLLLYATSTVLDSRFLNDLRNISEVKTDKNKKIIRYISHDGSLNLDSKRAQTESARAQPLPKNRIREEEGEEDRRSAPYEDLFGNCQSPKSSTPPEDVPQSNHSTLDLESNDFSMINANSKPKSEVSVKTEILTEVSEQAVDIERSISGNQDTKKLKNVACVLRCFTGSFKLTDSTVISNKLKTLEDSVGDSEIIDSRKVYKILEMVFGLHSIQLCLNCSNCDQMSLKDYLFGLKCIVLAMEFPQEFGNLNERISEKMKMLEATDENISLENVQLNLGLIICNLTHKTTETR